MFVGVFEVVIFDEEGDIVRLLGSDNLDDIEICDVEGDGGGYVFLGI